MKRALTAAAVLLLCASSAAAQDTDKDKKTKDRTPPASSEPAKPAKPAPRPQPRPAMAPAPQLQPRPTLQPQPAPSVRPERPARPDQPGKVRPNPQPRLETSPAMRPVPGPAPRSPKPAVDASPAMRPAPNPGPAKLRPPRPDRARPVIAESARPRPPVSALPTRPTPMARPARPASPQAIARSRQIRQQIVTQRVRTYSFRGRTLRAVKARPYAYPAHWRYRAWRRHQRFPAELFLTDFLLNNFLDYGLSAPPPGYQWVRYGPDAVLVSRDSYDIADTAYGVFDDGSGYGGASYADNADLPAIDEDMPQDFATGQLDLTAGVDQSNACDFFYGDRQTQDDIDRAWADQDWNGLAKTVIWAGCGNDISYYLLGLAAEGLVLPDAAGSYYGRATELADGNVDSTFKCALSGPEACRGMDIGREASAGLDRIYGPGD